MAEIDGTFPFNPIGLPRAGQGGDDASTGALANLRRAREEREERELEAQRTGERTDRVDVAREGREGGAVRPSEETVRRETETANAPERVLEDPAAADPRTLDAIQQAVAAVVRPPQPLEPEPRELRPGLIEPGVVGPVGRLQLEVQEPPPNPLTPPEPQQPPQPEDAPAPPNAVNPLPGPAQPQPESNVEQLEENRAALRADFLGTEPALRANRELRRFLVEPGEETGEPRAAGTDNANRLLNDREPFVPPGAQPETVTPSVPSAVQAERAEEARAEEAEEALRAARERREEEEEEQTPPPPVTPAALVTERGLNINQFI